MLFLAEFWVGEFLVFTVALLPEPTVGLAAFAIYQLLNMTCYQPPGGLRVAVSSRVGQALGAGEADAARRTWRAAMLLVLAWSALPAAVLLGAPAAVASIFTSDSHVIELLARLAPVLTTYVTLDAVLAVLAGALTGCGRQGLGGRLVDGRGGLGIRSPSKPALAEARLRLSKPALV